MISVNLRPVLRDDVVALYVDPRGPYPNLVKEWYDEKRDARTYQGNLPVVAHPPCGPWGNLRGMCCNQDKGAARAAVEQVRRFGGVLEHPETSRLFSDMAMWNDGIGKLWYVEQGAFGHIAQKRTFLYTVGIPASAIWSRDLRKRDSGRRVEDLSKEQRRRTPPAFAQWLIQLAAQARAKGAA
jgi:hypothetical protein